MYNNVIPAFQQFELEHGLPPLACFAKCFSSSTEPTNETLIIEDLRPLGYKSWPCDQSMSEDHILCVLREFGRFHALSLALRDQKPDVFETITKPIDDVYVKFFKHNPDFFRFSLNKALETLSPAEEAERRIVFKRFSNTVSDFIRDLPLLVDRYSVILHGDCWTNNLLFKYDEYKKPTDFRFIDLQFSRLGPPVIDLSYFFYICSPKHVIDDFKNYLNVYYTTLASHLTSLGSNPEKVYPLSVFWRQWKESARFGLILSMLLLKMMLSKPDEVIDVAEAAESGLNMDDWYSYDMADANEYYDKVKHIVLHFIDNHFL